MESNIQRYGEMMASACLTGVIEKEEYYFRGKIEDRIEGYTDWYIPKGDHCLVGSREQIHSLFTYFNNTSKKDIEAVSISGFLQSKLNLAFVKHGVRFVMINLEASSPEFIGRAISLCRHVYTYRPLKFEEYCKSSSQYRVTGNAEMQINKIASGVGMEQRQLREIFYGVSEKEFLEISNITGERWIRRLP